MHLAYNCFSNKYFETFTAMTNFNAISGEKKLLENEYLLSIFKLNTFSSKEESLFIKLRVLRAVRSKIKSSNGVGPNKNIFMERIFLQAWWRQKRTNELIIVTCRWIQDKNIKFGIIWKIFKWWYREYINVVKIKLGKNLIIEKYLLEWK